MDNHDKLALPVGTTLDRFIMRKQEDFPYATGELSQLLRDIALAAKIVNREINRSGLIDIAGAYGNRNVQGEDQQKLDVIANIRFIRALRNGGEVCTIISEEDEEMIQTGNTQGKYVVAIDPLDGSSNIDVNVSIGTIFSIYRRVSPTGSEGTAQDCMQTGTHQVAAGYVIYGSSTMMVYTTGNGVNGFTYEPSLGELFLSHPNIQIPATGKVYSVNEGTSEYFSEGMKNYVAYCKEQSYSARYIGSLVADFHRNLLKGGVYIYPGTSKVPNGKLRLMYECNPLAFIVEQAGGKSSDGRRRTLELEPTDMHQRCPVFIGSTEMVEKAEEFLAAELLQSEAK
ncbi:class 1 fructose-bisphosphatase [Hymenobacter lapidiphilus]|uniref:class 1 fructose-bisphosphatase n=1 Tax=Hymenobacter sp. CCM 8763 TaxID=2303334 RepID=UPI000E35555B|nr:class 1 fructose-bisphosphatase [Hymenobacter sp. CCM 8763]RFP66552.1 class 1 fructose-bisphosphatase [Hymenobacter sp. CCM 8763]